MKILKSALLILALIVGLSGALVSKICASTKPTDPIYNWVGGPSNFTGTIAQAQAFYGCGGSRYVCATGILKPGQTGPPTVVLFYD